MQSVLTVLARLRGHRTQAKKQDAEVSNAMAARHAGAEKESTSLALERNKGIRARCCRRGSIQLEAPASKALCSLPPTSRCTQQLSKRGAMAGAVPESSRAVHVALRALRCSVRLVLCIQPPVVIQVHIFIAQLLLFLGGVQTEGMEGVYGVQ